jgi:hypothetical protein
MVRALLLAYLYRVVCAALLAFPLAAGVAASGIGGFPEGDAKLFEPGGNYLIEMFTSQRALLEQLLMPTVVVLFVTALAAVMPEWILIRSLRPPTDEASPAPATTLREAGRALGRLVLIALSTWMARAVLMLATIGLMMTARSVVGSALDERLPTLVACATLPVGLLGWACLSALADLAAISVTLDDATPPRAIASALEALRHRGLRLGSVYGATALASLAVVGVGAALAASLDVARGGSWRTLAVALVHQLVILTQLGLRAAWLASALGASERKPGPAAQAEAFL